jgi:hypothetical protein
MLLVNLPLLQPLDFVGLIADVSGCIRVVTQCRHLHDPYCRMMAHFVRVLGHVQASNFNLVKAHATIHFPDNIWDYGAPDEYSTEPFESMHVQLLKIGYRGSNHRDAIPQVLNSYRRRRALRRRQGLDVDDDEEDDTAALPAGRESTLEKVRHEPGSSIYVFTG